MDLMHRSTEIIILSPGLVYQLVVIVGERKGVPTVHAEGSGSERVI